MTPLNMVGNFEIVKQATTGLNISTIERLTAIMIPGILKELQVKIASTGNILHIKSQRILIDFSLMQKSPMLLYGKESPNQRQ